MKAVRKIDSDGSKSIYLTFDDGPSLDSTQKVLEVLSDLKIKTTFFVVAKKAEAAKVLLKEREAFSFL